MSTKQLTVQELIDLLMKVEDKSIKVITEGCDCNGDAGGIEIEKDYVFITRVG